MTSDEYDKARHDSRDGLDEARRRSLKQIGGLAASVAPAMMVLLRPGDAGAHHNGRPSRPGGNGHCGGPRWNYGGGGNGHSGC